MIEKQVIHYVREGRPFKEVKHMRVIEGEDPTMTSCSADFNEDIDTVITPEAWAEMIEANKAEVDAIKQNIADSGQAVLNSNNLLKADIKAKLVGGIPLSESEADAVLSAL